MHIQRYKCKPSAVPNCVLNIVNTEATCAINLPSIAHPELTAHQNSLILLLQRPQTIDRLQPFIITLHVSVSNLLGLLSTHIRPPKPVESLSQAIQYEYDIHCGNRLAMILRLDDHVGA